MFVLPLGPISSRKGGDIRQQGHHHGGTEVLVGRNTRIVLRLGKRLFSEILHAFFVGHLSLCLAMKDNGLHLLGSHHSSNAGSACRAPIVVFNQGEADQILPGWPNHNGFGPFHAHPFCYSILRLIGSFAPETARIVKNHGLIADF